MCESNLGPLTVSDKLLTQPIHRSSWCLVVWVFHSISFIAAIFSLKSCMAICMLFVLALHTLYTFIYIETLPSFPGLSLLAMLCVTVWFGLYFACVFFFYEFASTLCTRSIQSISIFLAHPQLIVIANETGAMSAPAGNLRPDLQLMFVLFYKCLNMAAVQLACVRWKAWVVATWARQGFDSTLRVWLEICLKLSHFYTDVPSSSII